jgi:hypothetical protein
VVLGTAPKSARSVEPNGGALVVPGWPGQTPDASLFLVTDTGVRYPVANMTVAERLGYPKGTAVVVPPTLLDLLTLGPALDPRSADASPIETLSRHIQTADWADPSIRTNHRRRSIRGK